MVLQGKIIWDGTVEVFDLIGHPKVQVCYGWGHAAQDKPSKLRFVTVLGIPPIDSPLKAVQAVILNEIHQ